MANNKDKTKEISLRWATKDDGSFHGLRLYYRINSKYKWVRGKRVKKQEKCSTKVKKNSNSYHY